MARRSLVLFALAMVLALPIGASQFVQLPFDAVARNATLVVRGTIGPVTSAWDDAHEVIFSSAPLRVERYLGGTGPETLMVREVGGTVGNYTQEAIGFPTLREGQEVVLFLSRWDDSADWRIEAYNQGKFQVTRTPHGVMVAPDPVTQGHERAIEGGEGRIRANAVEAGMSIEELAAMINAARAADRGGAPADRKQ